MNPIISNIVFAPCFYIMFILYYQLSEMSTKKSGWVNLVFGLSPPTLRVVASGSESELCYHFWLNSDFCVHWSILHLRCWILLRDVVDCRLDIRSTLCKIYCVKM